MPMCSNWNTMSTSRRSGSVYRTPCSTVTPGVSPTVRISRPWARYGANTSRCISARNSCTRGPSV
ncbi:Uncharacterised protein [Mycobacteroides abscessus]|nr:Uncharacterised protein [Mycobacteroides abscessus]